MKRLLCVLLIFMLLPMRVTAESNDYGYGLKKARATAYCMGTVTASGNKVREGICAGKPEWMGKTILVYQRLPGDKVGDLIGIYECLDTGGTEAIKNGWVIDIYQPDLEACQDFMDLVYAEGCEGKIFIQVIDAAG